jgi:hypothetical protein
MIRFPGFYPKADLIEARPSGQRYAIAMIFPFCHKNREGSQKQTKQI